MKPDSFDQIFSGKKRVMVIMPHPDDTELYCGGTIARLLDNNIEVVTVKLTNGGKGTKQSSLSESELSVTRAKEDDNAAHALGIKNGNNIHLNIPDGEVENNLTTIEKVALCVRKFRPDLVITCNPEDLIIRFAKDANWVNHRDHRNTAKIAIDAVYPYSRDHAFFPQHLKEITEPYKPTTYFLFSDFYEHPDMVYIDITNFVDIKAKAWRCHESAYTPERVDESIVYLNKDDDKYYEAFRLVIAD